MLGKLQGIVNWISDKLDGLAREIGANYVRELLAAHGLIDIEIDHIRRKLTKEATE
jgi:hypothetical protein